MGLEGPGVRTSVDELQDRSLHLSEAARVQRVSNAVNHSRTGVRHIARLRPDDEVDIPCAYPGLGVGKTLVLIGKRTDRLAGDLERVGADCELAALGGDHLAPDTHMITKIDILPPVLEHLRSNGIE